MTGERITRLRDKELSHTDTRDLCVWRAQPNDGAPFICVFMYNKSARSAFQAK